MHPIITPGYKAPDYAESPEALRARIERERQERERRELARTQGIIPGAYTNERDALRASTRLLGNATKEGDR